MASVSMVLDYCKVSYYRIYVFYYLALNMMCVIYCYKLQHNEPIVCDFCVPAFLGSQVRMVFWYNQTANGHMVAGLKIKKKIAHYYMVDTR